MQNLQNLLLNFWLKRSALCLVVLLGFAITAVFTIAIREDEAWVGEPVYWYAQSGVIKSMLWQGYYLHEKEMVVHHFLFVRLSALALHLLPWHILSLRILPFVAGLACAWLLYLFARKEYGWTKQQALVPAALFLFFPINYEYLSYYRPEFWVALLGFGSFWSLYRFPESARFALLGGLLAGLAMLMHLNGLMYVCAGGLYLLLKRQWKSTFLFGLAAAIAFLPYLLVIINNLEMFRFQLTSPANSAGQNINWTGPFINLLNEQKRLFRGPHTIVVSVLALASLAVVFKLKKADKNLTLYLGLFVLFMGLLASSKTSQYSILFYPFVAVLVARALVFVSAEKLKPLAWLRTSFCIVLAIFTVFSFWWMLYLPFSEHQNTTAINRQLYKNIPAGASVAAPMNFIFDGIGRYDIRALHALFVTDTDGYQVKDLVVRFQEKDLQYLVLNPTWKGHFYDLHNQKPLFDKHFSEVKTVERNTLYRFSYKPE